MQESSMEHSRRFLGRFKDQIRQQSQPSVRHQTTTNPREHDPAAAFSNSSNSGPGQHAAVPGAAHHNQPKYMQLLQQPGVYVQNLALNITSSRLCQAFEQFGCVTSVQIHRPAAFHSTCYAFVNFRLATEAQQALDFYAEQQLVIDGRSAQVFAKKPPQAAPQPPHQPSLTAPIQPPVPPPSLRPSQHSTPLAQLHEQQQQQYSQSFGFSRQYNDGLPFSDQSPPSHQLVAARCDVPSSSSSLQSRSRPNSHGVTGVHGQEEYRMAFPDDDLRADDVDDQEQRQAWQQQPCDGRVTEEWLAAVEALQVAAKALFPPRPAG